MGKHISLGVEEHKEEITVFKQVSAWTLQLGACEKGTDMHSGQCPNSTSACAYDRSPYRLVLVKIKLMLAIRLVPK